MKRTFILLITICCSFNVFAQEDITTVILVRHAEKGFDEAGDPELTEEGKGRAELLATMLADQTVDKIYSTPFKRTHQTVAPLANAKGIAIEEYNPFKIDESIEQIKSQKGKTLVFSGHSNTIPILINKLLGNEEFKIISDDEYDNLFILTIVGERVKLLQLKYGS